MFKDIQNVVQKENEPLKNHSTIKIGGNAKYFLEIYDNLSLIKVVNRCKENNIKYKVIGLGAKLLFDSKGYDGAIIKLKTNKLRKYKNKIFVSAGVSLGRLCMYAYKHSLSNLEFSIGLPATVGGAIRNNVSAFNHSFSSCIKSITVLRNGKIEKVHLCKKMFCHHNSIFSNNDDIILSCVLELKPKETSKIKQDMEKFLNKRIQTQPKLNPNLGSTFRKNKIPPALLIEQSNLKGFCLYGAKISSKHSNFIINTGNATSQDVLDLISYIQNKVFKQTGYFLLPEIEFVPF